MKQKQRGCFRTALGVTIFLLVGVLVAAEDRPSGLEVLAGPDGHWLELQAPAPVQWTTHHPRPDLYVLALSGPGARGVEQARVVGGVVASFRLVPVAGQLRLEVLLNEPAHLTVEQPAAQRLRLHFESETGTAGSASVPPPTRAGGPGALATTAETPISVNFKDVDLKDFFRLIHEISGLNVVVDPNVRGTLTLVLEQVPWQQALDIVLRNNGLASERQGNVLRIATRETLRKEAEQRRELARAQEEAADVVTVTRTLSYARVADLRDTLKRFLTRRGEILADARSNTLIIRDVPSVIPTLDGLIQKLDRKSPQVEIEARVVLATRSFAREIGTQFGFATSTGNGKNVFGGVPSVGASPVVRNLLPPPPLVLTPPNGAQTPGVPGQPIPLNTNLGATSATSGITFAHTEPSLALDMILTAAETRGVGRLLSQPRLITQNNETAVVKQGTKIPVQTVINNTISVQFVDAVLQLEVTPQITADGNVFMTVHVENTAIDPAIPRILGIPALDTQAEDTKVLVTDGGTVVIGGIIISSQRTDVSQVPLFGSIPVIGHLFKHTAVSRQSQELLFFLTPRVLPG
jgi:type IV pilus assembly protein PilQ